MFTSCCPGWVRFVKSQFPTYTERLSSAKSPQQMFGAIAKSYFAEKQGIDPHKMFVVSIMPCSAKKAECELPTMARNRYTFYAEKARQEGLDEIADLYERMAKNETIHAKLFYQHLNGGISATTSNLMESMPGPPARILW